MFQVDAKSQVPPRFLLASKGHKTAVKVFPYDISQLCMPSVAAALLFGSSPREG
jgi:hypothetical protein